MSHQRRNFPNSVKREAYSRSNGICECHRLAARGIPGFSIEGCGVRLRAGHIRYEHIQPDALHGLNDLDNAAALTRNCWRKKTDEFDLPRIAKSNRVRDRARGISSSQFRPLPGTKASGIAKPFRGEPYYRDSGRAVFERRKG